MSARDALRIDIWEDIPDEDAEALLDAFAAEERAKAYREAADLAEDVANELHRARTIEQQNGAMNVADRLRARADVISKEQQ